MRRLECFRLLVNKQQQKRCHLKDWKFSSNKGIILSIFTLSMWASRGCWLMLKWSYFRKRAPCTWFFLFFQSSIFFFFFLLFYFKKCKQKKDLAGKQISFFSWLKLICITAYPVCPGKKQTHRHPQLTLSSQNVRKFWQWKNMKGEKSMHQECSC